MRAYWPANLRTISLAHPGAKKRELVFGLAFVVLVAIISVALTLQGWRSRAPAFDLLTYIYSIRKFLETGIIPLHGDTGSYGSYKPPGTAWLMLPSTILFADPRLSEYAGTALLHLSTLLGMFLIARSYFGLKSAYLAVLMYGLSENGIFFAGSLWPNGRPDFYVWVVFFTGLWVFRKEAKYLGIALAIWAVGMYVDMGVTPAFFIFPVAWLYYRPPVRLRSLIIAGAVVLVIWSPYLRFEFSRGFADIRSQLLQQSIRPANYQITWCDPLMTLQKLDAVSTTTQSGTTLFLMSSNVVQGPLSRLLLLAGSAWEKLVSNFRPVAPVSGASTILLLITLSSMLILSLPRSSLEKVAPLPRAFRFDLLKLLAVGMILSSLLVSKTFLGYFFTDFIALRPVLPQLYKLQKILLIGGTALLGIPWIFTIANELLKRTGLHIQTAENAEKVRFLIFSLLIPWSILLVLSEPGKPERFMWLWPVQVLFLAAFLTKILPRLNLPRSVIRIIQVVIPLIVIGNLFLLSRLDSWKITGWAGPDAEEVQVVDYVARQIKAEGKNRAAIGYQTFIYPFMAIYNITNPVYKVGAEYDIFFWYRHGIVNTDRCAEGFAANDEYRIVQLKPKSPDWAPRNYFDAPADQNLYVLGQLESYQVLKHR